MSFNMLLKLNTLPEKADALEAFFARILPETRTFEGCQWIDLYRVSATPHSFILIEEWKSVEDYQQYVAYRTSRGEADEMASLLAEPIDAVQLVTTRA